MECCTNRGADQTTYPNTTTNPNTGNYTTPTYSAAETRKADLLGLITIQEGYIAKYPVDLAEWGSLFTSMKIKISGVDTSLADAMTKLDALGAELGIYRKSADEDLKKHDEAEWVPIVQYGESVIQAVITYINLHSAGCSPNTVTGLHSQLAIAQYAPYAVGTPAGAKYKIDMVVVSMKSLTKSCTVQFTY